jgi:hypothetical protein
MNSQVTNKEDIMNSNISNWKMATAKSPAAWVAASALVLAGVAAPAFASRAVHSAQDSDSKAAKQDSNLQKWIDKLGSSNFDEREKAMDELKTLGDDALRALDKAGEDHADAEVRWNARRLAREIRRGDTGKVKKLKDLENEPQAGSRPQRSRGGIHIEIPDMRDWSGDLRQRMDQLNDQMQEMLKRMEGRMGGMRRLRLDLPQLQFEDVDSGVEVSIINGHVKVKVTEKDAKGESQVKTYEAPSMDEFKEKYPEIAEKYLSHIEMGGGKDFERTFKMDDLPEDEIHPFIYGISPNDESLRNGFSQKSFETVIGEENGERIGVQVAAVPRDVANFLGLKSNQGFVVKSVSKDSQAEALGMKENDVVIAVNGHAIGAGGMTFRAALASVATGETLKIEVVRGMEGKIRLEGRKLAPPSDDRKDSEPKSTPKKEKSKKADR